ncbi:MAG: DUF366 family protein [Peptococcaceae bacterium]|nr:DUF366 family protein [Peptococcaceae bacterium]
MHIFLPNERIKYTGHQLTSHWAYKNFSLQGDSIVCFRGPCQVAISEMVDLEDVLAEDHIYGPDMLQFIVEHFDDDLEKAILRQRILISIINETLVKTGLTRSGDDLFLEDRKFSVSIATVSPVSTMIHIGLNIISEGTPVKTVGLFDLGYQESEITQLGLRICEAYKNEMLSVRSARCKVRGVN